MADTHFPDEWLAHSLEGVVTPELLVELREKAPPPARLWVTLVAQKIASDEQILAALSTRFRLKLADLVHLDPAAKERVPEQVARRYHILPLRATDSYLEVATANPFDLDAEKALAFATAREIRIDRKSTRLNSSHSQISYAVFCLKKKKKCNITNLK